MAICVVCTIADRLQDAQAKMLYRNPRPSAPYPNKRHSGKIANSRADWSQFEQEFYRRRLVQDNGAAAGGDFRGSHADQSSGITNSQNGASSSLLGLLNGAAGGLPLEGR